MPQMARKPFMKSPWASPPEGSRGRSKEPQKSRVRPSIACHPRLIIIYTTRLSWSAVSSLSDISMRLTSTFLTCAFILTGSAAWADSRIFIVANQPDGYGVDQCLAHGEKCGAHAAQSYCQSRSFVDASSYRRVDPDEI